jgi:hypothetical protein
MKRFLIVGMAVAAVTAAALLGLTSAATAENGGKSDLFALKNATAPFHDVEKAIASGRVDLGLCVDQMGQHYADPQTFDHTVDPLDPEAMVYADDGKGHLKLVAVEWVATDPNQAVMGHPLHFNPAVGVYVLHAWIWAPNPVDMWADMNPRIGDCP